MTENLLDLALMLRVDQELPALKYRTMLASRLGYLAVHIPYSTEHPIPSESIDELVDAAGTMMVVLDEGTDSVGVVRRFDLDAVRRARAELDSLEDASPLIVAVPISIGRTSTEAVARADREPLFTGDAHPQNSGIFGTFEQAQQQVLDLAQAGAEVLLVTVPEEEDIADVLAQVKALVVGATPALFNQ
jgi:alkanesulfonate monooxygenase SsuD/methylene tetrahydromethanopterin reductase-like flavin-dependent oxidoreductase (luciferase family)